MSFLLKLGRIARYKGVGEEELARLKTLAVERLAGMGVCRRGYTSAHRLRIPVCRHEQGVRNTCFQGSQGSGLTYAVF